MIECHCTCGTVHYLRDEAAGKNLSCSACGRTFHLRVARPKPTRFDFKSAILGAAVASCVVFSCFVAYLLSSSPAPPRVIEKPVEEVVIRRVEVPVEKLIPVPVETDVAGPSAVPVETASVEPTAAPVDGGRLDPAEPLIGSGAAVLDRPASRPSPALPIEKEPPVRPTVSAPIDSSAPLDTRLTPAKPPVAENGSYYGEISETTGRPKTVYVRGYYRKDGTYVRSHYRSPPSSGSETVESKPSLTPRPEYKPPVAENGSRYGEISPATGRPKTVYVRGYYRKDGTYVRGHYRSKPRRWQ
jgi:hypothetical protein